MKYQRFVINESKKNFLKKTFFKKKSILMSNRFPAGRGWHLKNTELYLSFIFYT